MIQSGLHPHCQHASPPHRGARTLHAQLPRTIVADSRQPASPTQPKRTTLFRERHLQKPRRLAVRARWRCPRRMSGRHTARATSRAAWIASARDRRVRGRRGDSRYRYSVTNRGKEGKRHPRDAAGNPRRPSRLSACLCLLSGAGIIASPMSSGSIRELCCQSSLARPRCMSWSRTGWDPVFRPALKSIRFKDPETSEQDSLDECHVANRQ